MADEHNVDEAVVEKVTNLQKKYLEKAAEVHLKPYLSQISEGVQRCMKLADAARKTDKENLGGDSPSCRRSEPCLP